MGIVTNNTLLALNERKKSMTTMIAKTSPIQSTSIILFKLSPTKDA